MLALAATAATGVLLHTASTRQHVTALVADHHAALLHLLATTLSTGLQLWTTFGSGIIAFKTLPRHTFGHLQSKLFPVYFSIVCVTTALQLLTLFVMTSQLATPASQFQFKVNKTGNFLKRFSPYVPTGPARGAGWRSAQHRCVWYAPALLHLISRTTPHRARNDVRYATAPRL